MVLTFGSYDDWYAAQFCREEQRGVCASLPGGRAYAAVQEALKRQEAQQKAARGMSTVWFGDQPVWGIYADNGAWVHPFSPCGRHNATFSQRHGMWNAKVESATSDSEPEVGKQYPCWCCAWLELLDDCHRSGMQLYCCTSNIFHFSWVDTLEAGSSETSEERFRHPKPEGGEGVISLTHDNDKHPFPHLRQQRHSVEQPQRSWWQSFCCSKSSTNLAPMMVNFRTDGFLPPHSILCLASIPGLYREVWEAVVAMSEMGKAASACVFINSPDPRFGRHELNPEMPGKCYCRKLYGTAQPWGCAWFKVWKENIAKATDLGLPLAVIYKAGGVGMSDPFWDDLPLPDPEGHPGLGMSQVCEVAWLNQLGVPYSRMDIKDVVPTLVEKMSQPLPRISQVHARTGQPLGMGCRWERKALDEKDYEVKCFFAP